MTHPGERLSSIMDAGFYVDGVRIASPTTFDQSFRILDEHAEGFVWIGLYRPSHADMTLLASEFQLSPLLVEDTITAHQRPKFERYGETLFLVLRAARYIDRTETVDFGEVHAIVGDRFVVTVRHAETPDLTPVRRELESAPETLAIGPSVVLERLLDRIVDEYRPVIAGIENDIEDHAIHVTEHVEVLRETLKGALDLNMSLQTQRQNEEARTMTEASLRQAEDSRRIAAWAGVLFVPSLVTGTYGMNFRNMPELDWPWGYGFALGLMVVTGVAMYLIFTSKKWL